MFSASLTAEFRLLQLVRCRMSQSRDRAGPIGMASQKHPAAVDIAKARKAV